MQINANPLLDTKYHVRTFPTALTSTPPDISCWMVPTSPRAHALKSCGGWMKHWSNSLMQYINCKISTSFKKVFECTTTVILLRPKSFPCLCSYSTRSSLHMRYIICMTPWLTIILGNAICSCFFISIIPSIQWYACTCTTIHYT